MPSILPVSPRSKKRHKFNRSEVVLGAKKTIQKHKPLIWVENEPYFDEPSNRTFVEPRKYHKSTLLFMLLGLPVATCRKELNAFLIRLYFIKQEHEELPEQPLKNVGFGRCGLLAG